MKRRKFIQSTLAVSAVASISGTAVAAADTRVFGTPTSLTGGTDVNATRMLLPLSRSGMPAAGWDHWSKLSAAAVDMFSDEKKRSLFNTNPSRYLSTLGFDTSKETLDAPSLALLVALSDRDVQDAAKRGDYTQMLSYLQASGSLARPKEDVLTMKMQQALQSNKDMIRSVMDLAGDEYPDAETVLAFIKATDKPPTTADLAALASVAELLRTAPGQAVVGAAVIVIAAVDAVVGVTVAVAAFTMVAVANKVLVAGNQLPAYNHVFNGQLSRLDGDICDSCDVAHRAASILGAPGLYDEHAKLVIKNEVRSFLRAMRNVGLVTYDEDAFETIVEATYIYGMRSISAE
ncbi:hypothetical protein [Stenotrophomonas rhizophila]|uniref:Secreted protein n=1 Tax=Stenotrophomonas rhizophila TaxID=216778 RepID=A0A7V7YDL6_9GAMM|nr:hypothetical protein [Stenotrophomonas rhizophila]KAB7628896.1 hypothetical protein F9K92_15735 [Stenotrophomonas rhizophila]